jgi:hypothetical protein
MARIGRYCKAYQLHRFRQFSGWIQKVGTQEKKEGDGKEVQFHRELDDNSILYLQRNYIVTDGIFIDENVVFDHITPEWMQFCSDILKFEIPKYIIDSEATPEEALRTETVNSANPE